VSNRWDLVSRGIVASAAPGTESLSASGVGIAAGWRRADCGVRSPIRTKVPSELGATWSMPTGVLLSVVFALADVVLVERKLFAPTLAVLVARAAGVLNDHRRRKPERGGPSSGLHMRERFRASASGVEHGAFSLRLVVYEADGASERPLCCVTETGFASSIAMQGTRG
jgi:hypothetical protein